MTRLGIRIREERERQALSQVCLAEMTGLTPDQVRAVETGRQGAIQHDRVMAVCSALGISGDEILHCWEMDDAARRRAG